jgi:dipeptidyl aminopeptidase/acylaminoacyl peptidase
MNQWGIVYGESELIGYRGTQNGWKQVSVTPTDLFGPGDIDISLEEGINTPPKIFATDLARKQRALLLDPNPRFSDIKFGKVEDITFTSHDGRKVRGGLYYPPDYVRGKRYPFVIQTHDWVPGRFWIRGAPFATGFAAQPLAARDIVVLQIEEESATATMADEILREESNYEGAIDYLAEIGLIDRHHVGIVAFSQTGGGVAYTLTHSTYEFVTASLDSTADYGYFYYLAQRNTDLENYYGGVPWVANVLAEWVKTCPGFNLGKVRAAVRLQANGPQDLTFIWEWFVGLHRINKPVELIYLPAAAHNVVKPSEQLISQQGNLDWFCFWLKDEEDPNPTKKEQYFRWRELRKLQEQNARQPQQANPPSVH